MSVNDPMMESKHHDPMLDGITRYGDPTHDYMLPAHGEGFVVLFSDLPALLAAAREDERQRVTSDFAEYRRHMEEWQAGYNKGHAAGVEQGQRDERERIRTGVTGLPWEVAVSFGPIDCDYSCEEGPCGCSGVMRPEGWTTGLEDVLAVIDAGRRR